MKNSKKIMLRVVPIIFVLVVVFTTSVFASSPITPELNTGNDSIGSVDNVANSIWNTVALILQIAAIAAIVIAGVRYMFASADTKADIKKQMIVLVIGAVLVFGATTVIQFITTVTNEVVGGQ